ncbi:hypothetical protein H2198_007584 [Neophaeococcomyces mojaviensis]|uniref:Uncharacterized protein n=1 Tax=Neophaeococcomyces mojaviensis TaxID=3383035 RepID=A0ACC3A038_9EURO|nr:hypothetical protein H2198_007584 [Knufia sp. JES_112]
MSDTVADPELYEVERVLAEQDWGDEGRKYLVKWKGYPDEECTWEGSDAFTQGETLKCWWQQQASGDVLDEFELLALGERMKQFNEGQNQTSVHLESVKAGTSGQDLGADFEASGDDENYYGSMDEADENQPTSDLSDVARSIDDESLRPKKRARVVSTHTFTSSFANSIHKGTSSFDTWRQITSSYSMPTKKGIAHRSGDRAPHLSLKTQPRRQSLGDRYTAPDTSTATSQSYAVKPKKSKAAPPVHTTLTTPSSNTMSIPQPSVLPRSASGPTQCASHPAQLTKFHVPELGRRSRTTQSHGPASAATRMNHDSAGKNFKTLRQMNNAQKKIREEAAPSVPTKTFNPSKGTQSSKPLAQDAGDPDPGSPLFFPWDDKESERNPPKDHPEEADNFARSEAGKAPKNSLSRHISSILTSTNRGSKKTESKPSTQQTLLNEALPNATNIFQSSARKSSPEPTPTRGPQLSECMETRSLATEARIANLSVRDLPMSVEKEPSHASALVKQALVDVTQIDGGLGASEDTVMQDIQPITPTVSTSNVSVSAAATPQLESLTLGTTFLARQQTRQSKGEISTLRNLQHQVEVAVRLPDTRQVDVLEHQSTSLPVANTEPAVAVHRSGETNLEPRVCDVSSNHTTFAEQAQPSFPPFTRNPPSEPRAERDRTAASSTDPSLRDVHPSEVVRSWSGTIERHWRRGDLVLEFFMEGREVGDVKVLGIPWEPGNKIIHSREKDVRKVRIDFEYSLTRPRYDELTQTVWFRTLGQGPTEPFADTYAALSSLASYLEIHNLAGIWNHPYEDLMLVLYSCRSPDWKDLGEAAPRAGSKRLQILIRQKFHELKHDQRRGALENSTRGVSPYKGNETPRSPVCDRGDRERFQYSPPLVNSRSRRMSTISNPGPSDGVYYGSRSRRSSIASNTSHYCNTPLMSTVSKSPSDQLAQNLNHAINTEQGGAGATTGDDNGNNGDVEPVTGATGDHVSAHLIATSFSGFDRDLAGLTTPPIKLSERYNKNDIWILFAYTSNSTRKIQLVKQWLVTQGFPSDHILDKSSSGSWMIFTKQLTQRSVGVIILDQGYEFYRLSDLGRFLENNNLLCWQADFSLTSDVPLPMTRLFTYGTAIVICEGSLLEEPERVFKILKWFKKAVAAAPSTKLMLPPNIRTTLQDQAVLTRKPEVSKLFLNITFIIEQLITSSMSSIKSPGALPTSLDYDSGVELLSPSDQFDSSLSSTVIMPLWTAVYKNILESANTLPASEQRDRAENMDKAMVSYFAAWAQRHITEYRSFIAIVIGGKKEGHGHVRQCQAESFLARYAQGNREKEAAR